MEMHQFADAPANLESIAPGIIAFYAGFESKQKTFAFERDLKSGLGVLSSSLKDQALKRLSH